jgi:arsenite methyltransferase
MEGFPMTDASFTNKQVKDIVKKKYAAIAQERGCCCKPAPLRDRDRTVAKQIGYSDEEIALAADANMGLGCGNPTALVEIAEGDTVVDLGSGAGFDCFLARRRTGPSGLVIGIDMTKEMIKKARANALKLGYGNVRFHHAEIEKLPLEDGTIDVVISNCVINLAPDKRKVFAEAYRVLRPGGRLCVSDIVLLGDLTAAQRADPDLLAGCVAGAIPREEYLGIIAQAGFTIKRIDEDKGISKTQYRGIPLESLKLVATK